MPRYNYIAKSLRGEEKMGSQEAKDPHQLAAALRQTGFILVKAEQEGGIQKRNFEISLPFLGVPLAEKMFFTRNLQVMVSAGLPLPRALETLASQAKNKKFQRAILEIKESISKGSSFSGALAKHPDIFSELFQSMVAVGEEGGTLDEVLKTLALQLEREHDLKSKIRGAMIYPLVIVCAMVGIGILMLVTVVPQLNQTFKDMNVDLPLTTKMVIKSADLLVKRWYLIAPVFVFLIYFFWRLSRSKAGKKIIGLLALRIPVFSPVVKSANSASTARTLSSLISAGISLPKALEITSKVLGNHFYKNSLLAAEEKVKKGEKLSAALKGSEKIFPATLIQMIGVGEETGETSSILAKLADFYEQEVSDVTKNLASIIEPILMIIIGAVVGFFAVSMIQPMYSMLGSIK